MGLFLDKKTDASQVLNNGEDSPRYTLDYCTPELPRIKQNRPHNEGHTEATVKLSAFTYRRISQILWPFCPIESKYLRHLFLRSIAYNGKMQHPETTITRRILFLKRKASFKHQYMYQHEWISKTYFS